MAAGCYAAPQFQFSSPAGGTTQQFFISPQNAGMSATGQALLHWSPNPAAVQFQQHPQQPQTQQQQQQTIPAGWQGVSTIGAAAIYNPQPQQVGTPVQSVTGGTTTSTVSVSQPQPMFAPQPAIQQASVQVAQQPQQQLLFASQHAAVGLQAAGAATAQAAYPQQVYLAQAPPGEYR